VYSFIQPKPGHKSPILQRKNPSHLGTIIRYYNTVKIYIKDRHDGPFSEAEILDQIRYAGLCSSALARVDSQGEWLPISSLVEEKRILSTEGESNFTNQKTKKNLPKPRSISKTRFPNREVSGIQYDINKKETVYFTIKCTVTLVSILWIAISILYGAKKAAVFLPFIFYVLLIYTFQMFAHALAMGHIKANAIRVTEDQFPEIYNIVLKHSQSLNLDAIPFTYIVQAGGMLNAFATRFCMENYIILYSDIVETAYDNGPEALSFIIGHELGHVKRRHIQKNTWLLPSAFFPFLNSAYSRACEYTCDNIGASLSPQGAVDGILILSAGKRLYSKVNTEYYLKQIEEEEGFWTWFAEKLSSHPAAPKRIKNIAPVYRG